MGTSASSSISSSKVKHNKNVNAVIDFKYYDDIDDIDNTDDWRKGVIEFKKSFMHIRPLVHGVVGLGRVEYVLNLADCPTVTLEKEKIDEKKTQYIIFVSCKAVILMVKASSHDFAHKWIHILREEIMIAKAVLEDDGLHGIKNATQQDSGGDVSTMSSDNQMNIKPPRMTIVILVVGTRGDVQPFVYLGQALKRDGHRVRLATHAEYRPDVVAKGGLEYYPLGGDPRKLSEYMVKTGGRLMPDILNKEEMNALPEKMKMLRDITFSCFPACTAPDPEDPYQNPFSADAIISNPVSYGHIHCAESLGVPLVCRVSSLFAM